MSETKKYELTSETLRYKGCTLHRIKALKDFGSIKAGELGGWIESEENLSQANNAWVYGDSKVYDDAVICGNARVRGKVEIFDNAKVYGEVIVYDNAKVYDDAEVCDNAQVYDNAEVCDNAHVYDNAIIYGDSHVYGDAKIYGDAFVYGRANVYRNAKIYNEARVCGNACVHDYAEIYNDSHVFGNAEICGHAKVCNNADYIVFKNFWSSGRYFTWTRSNNKWCVGCFYGTGEELIIKAYADSEISGREYERVVRYVEGILADEKKRSN